MEIICFIKEDCRAAGGCIGDINRVLVKYPEFESYSMELCQGAIKLLEKHGCKIEYRYKQPELTYQYL